MSLVSDPFSQGGSPAPFPQEVRVATTIAAQQPGGASTAWGRLPTARNPGNGAKPLPPPVRDDRSKRGRPANSKPDGDRSAPPCERRSAPSGSVPPDTRPRRSTPSKSIRRSSRTVQFDAARVDEARAADRIEPVAAAPERRDAQQVAGIGRRDRGRSLGRRPRSPACRRDGDRQDAPGRRATGSPAERRPSRNLRAAGRGRRRASRATPARRQSDRRPRPPFFADSSAPASRSAERDLSGNKSGRRSGGQSGGCCRRSDGARPGAPPDGRARAPPRRLSGQ